MTDERKLTYRKKKNTSVTLKRTDYLKSALSPYFNKADANFIKSLIQRMKPVKGPNKSIKQSIDKYKKSNLDNV